MVGQSLTALIKPYIAVIMNIGRRQSSMLRVTLACLAIMHDVHNFIFAYAV